MTPSQTNVAPKRRGRPVGTARTRVEMTFRSTGASQVFTGYEEAAFRLGVSVPTLRVYLSHGKGRIQRSIWSDALEAYDIVTVRRIGVDPTTATR